MKCASCSQALPEGANFCPFCGRAVSPAAGGEERRVVTVLFADIVGFTGLSEHLDPERVKRLIDGAFERMIADIDNYGGRVDKVLGDGILALFGAPVAHEDDPDRAIRAALRMQQSLTQYSTDHGLVRPIELRVGINTGEVVVGRISGTDDYTALGDTVNVSSRLQAMAPPGGVYIGDSTAMRAADEILRESVDDLEVRGREQTERVWRVTGVQRGGPLIGLRSDVPFIGRSDQRELMGSIMAMVAGGRSAVVAVTGEAGSGKTRLVAEALHRFPGQNAVVFGGACAPYGETNVWSPIASALLSSLKFDRAVSPQALRDMSRSKGMQVYGFAEDDPVLHWFVESMVHLAGHPSELDNVPPAQARETLFRLIVEGLRRRSHEGPVVVWIDDLQWADALMLDLLRRIARSLADRPVLVITAQRDDAELPWPPASDRSIIVRLALDPLSRAESDALLEAVLGQPASPLLAEQLYERSGGNPLFLSELASFAAADDDGLPNSLRALIASRLDQLDPDARAIIDNASVLGTGGPVSALAMFASVLHQPFSQADVDALVSAGLLELDGDWWRFRNDLVREVAYQTLTKALRAERHAGTAAVMSEIAGVPIEALAHHTASAAELVAEIGAVSDVPETITQDAIELLRQAAQRSLDIGAFNQARTLAARGVALCSADHAVRRELVLVGAQAHTERRESPQARNLAQMALDSAVDEGDRHDEATARRLLGRIAQMEGHLDLARTELARSVEIFRDLDALAELAQSLGDRGFVEVFGGSLADGDAILAEAEALADRLGNRRASAWAREHRAWVAFLSGDVALAEHRLELAMAMFDDLGDQAGQIWAQALRAYLYFFERNFADAEKLATTVRADALQLGERWGPAMMDSLLASLRLWEGNFTEAEALSRRSLVEFRDIGDRFGIVQALGPNARALVALGRNDDAEQAMEEALSLSEWFGDLSFPIMAAAGTAVHLGLGERGVVLAETALGHIAAMGANGSEARVTLAVGLCQVGRPEDGLATLLDVDVDFPYAHAVRALASAMLGDHRQSLADADIVAADPGATYLDQVTAAIAAAASLAAGGEHESAADRLREAADTAKATGDAVAQSLVAHADAALCSDGIAPAGVLAAGWRRVVADLASVPA